MKKYKVEARTYFSKITSNKNHISESSADEIQYLLDDYVTRGWALVSTDATSFGSAMYVYLYFEKDE